MWLCAVLLLTITPKALPQPTCQLSDCVYGTPPNCSLQNLTIAKARPVRPDPSTQLVVSGDHLFALLYDPTGNDSCMFLTLELSANSNYHYVLHLIVGNDHDPQNVITHKFETIRTTTGCIERTPIYSCVNHMFEQIRLTIFEDEESFALEDGTPTVPPGTRMLFRKGHPEQLRDCSRRRYGSFWRNLDWTRRCERGDLGIGKREESLKVEAASGQDLTLGVTVGILLVLWLVWLLAIGLRKMYIVFVRKR